VHEAGKSREVMAAGGGGVHREAVRFGGDG
jgi:hypothetical protein